MAFDLSLTATGYSMEGLLGDVLSPPRGSDRGMPRLAWIRDQVLDLSVDADVVVLEGYAMGSKRQSHTRAIGELGGVVRLALFERGTPYVEVPPATLKKLATGRGNAPKEEVLAAAIRRLGYGGHDNNEADALWLRTAALIHYGLPDAPELPKMQREALGKVEWPEVTSAERRVA